MSILPVGSTDWFSHSNSNSTLDTSSKKDSSMISSASQAKFSAINPDNDIAQISEDAKVMFSKLDTDGSGSLTEDEFDESCSETYSETYSEMYSTTHSATLASKWANKCSETTSQELFSSYDTDSSGSLSESEYITAMRNLAVQPNAPSSIGTDVEIEKTDSSMDINQDGVVSFEESTAAISKVSELETERDK